MTINFRVLGNGPRAQTTYFANLHEEKYFHERLVKAVAQVETSTGHMMVVCINGEKTIYVVDR